MAYSIVDDLQYFDKVAASLGVFHGQGIDECLVYVSDLAGEEFYIVAAMVAVRMGVREAPPSTPFFECRESFDCVVIERNDGARVEISDHVIRTPGRCCHWTGGGDILARRTGFAEVVFTKPDIPVDIIVRPDEIILWEPGRFRECHDWHPTRSTDG